MKAILLWLASPEWGQIVKALLHSLWQGGVLAVLVGLALRRVSAPSLRYRLALGSLGAMLLATVFTWAMLSQNPSRSGDQTGNSPLYPASALQTGQQLNGPTETLVFTVAGTRQINIAAPPMQWTGWLALGWLLGALLMLTRAGIQVTGAERLRRSGRPPADPRIAQLLAEAQRAVRLVRKIHVTVTDTLTSPAVVGVLVPTLILPLSLVTTLTHEQLRFVLLHELAHIRRGDYFANLFQLLMEALLFFNPAVWWISHQVRREREASCDALAIELSGAPVAYARTLVHVAENALSPSPAAAAAFGNKQREPSSLSDRVQRLLVPGYRPALRLTWHAMLMSLVAGGTLLVLSALGTRNTVGAILAGETRNESQGSDLQTSSNSTPSISTAASSARETNTLIVGGNQADIAEKRTAYDLANNGRATIIKKLDRIHLDRVHFESTPLSDVLRVLAQAAKEQDPQGRGINFIYNSGDQPSEVMEQPPLDQHRILNDELAKREKERSNLRDRFTNEHPRVLQLNLEISRLTRVKASLEPVLITIAPMPTILPLADLLNIIVTNASQPIHCSIQDFGVLFTRGIPPENLLTRRIKVHPATLYRWSDPPNYVDAPPRTNRLVAPLVDSSLDHTKHPLHRLFTEAGIDMQPPKTFFYKDRIGELFVRATPAEIERLTKLLAETDRETARGFSDDLFAVNAKTTKDASQTSNAVNESSSSLKSSELRELTDKVPVLGDLPLIGKLFRSGANGQSSAVEDTSQLYVRRFKVDPNTFTKNLEGTISHQAKPTDIVAAVRDFFGSFGVELNPPKNIYFKDRAGELLVRATLQDLDIIEEALQALNAPIPQVNIKVRFVEVDSRNGFGFDWFIGNMILTATHSATGDSPSQFSGILTEPQYRVVLRALEQRKGAKVLAMQEVTTFSGRQAQIQTVELRTVINGMNLPLPALPGHATTNSSTNPAYQTQVLPFGAVLDVIPFVAADGYTVQMTILPTVTEFLGYDDPGKVLPGLRNRKREGELPLPRVRVRQMSMSANVWDGQTLVLRTASEETLSKKTDGSIERNASRDANKQLLIFITPTIIDQGGNRMSAGDALPIERTSPPQTPSK